MLKNIILSAMILAMMGNKAFPDTLKTPSIRAVSNFTWAFRDYMKRHDNVPPLSWQQFNVDMVRRYPVVLENAQIYLDIENRYAFFEEPLEFNIAGKKEKFLMMALDAELEGETSSNSSKPKPGRFVYFLDELGKVYHRRYPEVLLQRIFSEKGLNLEDYTKARDFDPPKQHTHSHPGKWNNLIRGGNGQNKKHVKGSSSDKKTGVIEGGISDGQDRDPLNIWILSLIIILLFVTVIVGLKIRVK